MKFFTRNWKKFVIVLVLIAVGLFIFNKSKSGSKAQTFDPQKDKLVNPIRQNIKEEITLAGSIDSANKAELRFPVGGKLNWLGVKVGDSVKKWQAVASLDKSDLQKQYQKLMNDYLTNRWNFEDTQDKYKTTKENYLVTDDIKRILERTNFSLSNAVLDVEIKNIALQNATLISPINGIVTGIDQSNSGVNILPSSFAINVIDPQSLFFRSEIDQEEVTKVKIGQATTVHLDSFPDAQIDSNITYIAFTPIPGQTSTVYEIRFALPLQNSDLIYRLGMDGDAAILLSENQNVLTLPLEAVYEENGQKYVLAQVNNQTVKKTIQTGIETDTLVEIINGVGESDQIIVKKL
jgi:RND family efflux transporter MFP subunit